MAEVGLIARDRVRRIYVKMGGMVARCVDQRLLHGERVTVVVCCHWTHVHDRLHDRHAVLRTDCPAGDAARGAVYGCYNIRFVFLSPTKVCNSSNSIVFGCRGTVAGGSAAIEALIH